MDIENSLLLPNIIEFGHTFKKTIWVLHNALLKTRQLMKTMLGERSLKLGLFGIQSPNQVHTKSPIAFIFKVYRREKTAQAVIEIQRCVEVVVVVNPQASTIFKSDILRDKHNCRTPVPLKLLFVLCSD